MDCTRRKTFRCCWASPSKRWKSAGKTVNQFGKIQRREMESWFGIRPVLAARRKLQRSFWIACAKRHDKSVHFIFLCPKCSPNDLNGRVVTLKLNQCAGKKSR